MLEFMNTLGETVAVLPVMEHWPIVARLNRWPGRTKSRGTETPLEATQATIVIWNDASTIFDQTFFDQVTAITFLVLFFWANPISSMLKIRLSVIFRSMTCFMKSHVNICRPSSVASALTHLITWEVRVVNNGCQFMNRFNHPPPQIPCWLSQSIKSPVDLVSFQQDHVLGHWISMTLHPNYSINQVRLFRSRPIFSNVLPLYSYPPSNFSSGNVGEMVTYDHKFFPSQYSSIARSSSSSL